MSETQYSSTKLSVFYQYISLNDIDDFLLSWCLLQVMVLLPWRHLLAAAVAAAAALAAVEAAVGGAQTHTLVPYLRWGERGGDIGEGI